MTTKASLPVARLYHVDVGARVRLAGDSKLRTLVAKVGHYAHFDNFRASLACPVDPERMVFGEGGWRMRR
jgi:hypothetical protein